jgi:hypothetical protein
MHVAAGGAVRSSLDIWKTVERLFVRLNSGRDLLPGTRAHNHHHAHDLDPRDSQLWQGKTPRRSLSRVIEYHQCVSVELISVCPWNSHVLLDTEDKRLCAPASTARLVPERHDRGARAAVPAATVLGGSSDSKGPLATTLDGAVRLGAGLGRRDTGP